MARRKGFDIDRLAIKLLNGRFAFQPLIYDGYYHEDCTDTFCH